MPRWPQDSRRRLIDAALNVFVDRGYADSTIDDIAKKAGVTSRTFFRQFADKEEVLFGDDERLLPVLTAAIAEGDGPVRAEALMRHALHALAAVLDPQRESLRVRQQIIDSQISLSGRDLAKQAQWQQVVAAALVSRGFKADQADVLAAIGFALFRRALHSWLAEEGGPSLGERVDEALASARSILDASSAR
jgi:AcrR family transcriptional regulator